MHFKHPEILYFLFLLAIPILVHLFQLRRFKKEYFTNVRFLKELSIQTRKSSKLKKWLLLATRLLILTCIIFAFAQPFFEAKDNKNITNELYILLDNSFSMQAKGQKGELLKRAVEDLLEHIPENQNFSLITNSETFWNTDIKSIRNDLQKTNYSAVTFQPDNMMAKLKSHKSPYNKDIIVITDAVGLKQKQLESIDKDFNTYFINPKSEQKNNVSVDSVFISEAMDDFYEIGIVLSKYGDQDKDIPVGLYNNGKLAAKTSVKFDAPKKTLNFKIPKQDFHGFAAITDNGLEYDNKLFFSISKPEKTNVISIGEIEKSLFLSRIYTNDEFNFNNFTIQDLDYNLLEKQDAIVLNELKEIPQALQTTLKSFVEKGGNVVVIPALDISVSGMNSFLTNFGAIQFKNVVNTEKLITKIAFGNPLYHSVFEKKIENFQYPNTKSAFVISSQSPAILSYDDQGIFLSAIQNPVSAVYVFAAPINKTNSNFQNSPLIVPTFYNMAQNATKTGVLALTIGNRNFFLVDAVLSKDEIVNVKENASQSAEEFIPVQQVLNNKVKLSFNDYPQQAGNFGIFKRDELLRNISFNYDRSESDISGDNSGLLSQYNVVASVESVFYTLLTNRTNNEIWKWFVIFTLLFLVTELFIQKFVK